MPVLKELVVGDEPAVWERLGFLVDGNRCRVGHVDVVFDPSVGKGIRKWTLVGEGPDSLEGVPTDWLTAGRYELEVATERVPAAIHLAPLYDPKMERIKC